MDPVLRQLFLHVRKVHPPDALPVPGQRAVDDAVAAVGQASGKADVGGRVDQHLVPLGAHRAQGAEHAAQHTVLIADALLGQPGDAVAVRLPPDDGVEVRLRRLEVAVGGVASPVHDGLGDSGDGGKVHVRHPHGDQVEPLLGPVGGEARSAAQAVHRQGVPAPAVQNGGKIVFHSEKRPFLSFLYYNPSRRRTQEGNFPQHTRTKVGQTMQSIQLLPLEFVANTA